MIALIGQTASGKSSIYLELIKRGYLPMPPETTREKRARETSIDYDFVSKFNFMIDKLFGIFIVDSKYKLADGTVVRYGLPTPTKAQEDKGVVIINPKWIAPLQKYCIRNNIPLMIAYITATDNEIARRLMDRGDNLAEAQRRIRSDKKDFENVMNLLDNCPFYVNSDGTLKLIVSKIISDYELNFKNN